MDSENNSYFSHSVHLAVIKINSFYRGSGCMKKRAGLKNRATKIIISKQRKWFH